MKLLKLVLCILTFVHSFSSFASNEVLADYVHEPEEEFRVLKTTLVSIHDDYKIYNINFNSLKWLDKNRVDDPVWNHNLVIIVPNIIESENCFYRISNGSRNEKVPDDIHPIVRHVSLEKKAVGIEIRNIPNQPIKFKDIDQDLIEDGIIAYGWDKFLRNDDKDYIVRLPMLKASYLGFRVARDFLKQNDIEVSEYIAFGESKRGWVVWLLPIVDPQIKAILPSVIDVLNVQKSMKHHQSVYGDWSPVLQDYEKFEIPSRMFSKEFASLTDIIDPLNYRETLDLPKLVINAGNDQFFLPDNSQFYFDQLIGENRLMFLPNEGHQFRLNKEQLESIATYFSLVDQEKPLPKIFWQKDKDNISIRSDTKIQELRVWRATNGQARDFRLWDDNSPRYVKTEIPLEAGQSLIRVHVEKETDNLFSSTFVEVVFSLPEGKISFTTEAFVE